VVEALHARNPGLEFFGCAGPRMQAVGVRPVIDTRSIAVVGLVEVIVHIPRIWGQFRKLISAAKTEAPDLAILTDAPDFNLRVAKKLHKLGIPVVYLIAPQAWAWREGRVKGMRKTIRHLLSIFPFEQAFFEERGVPTTYIGHPLAVAVKPTLTRQEFCEKFSIPDDARILALLPGSRHGEVERHLPAVLEAAAILRKRYSVTPVMALPPGFNAKESSFWERIRASSIQVIEGYTWDVLAQSELALAKSGTIAMEAAVLGIPVVTFYRVNALSWILGRWLVKAPFLSTPNLVAGRRVVPELIQNDMTAERIVAEAAPLLEKGPARASMLAALAEIGAKLTTSRDPMQTAASVIEQFGFNR
jgi:lipid-A-disaccharide synthase